MLPRPLSSLEHPRQAIRRFTPNWFTITMGTGVVALALNQVPLDIPGRAALARALWITNIALFGAFAILYTARWMLYRPEARRIFEHPVMCMFFGAIPMALATLINGLLVFGASDGSGAAIDVAHVLWWLDVALSLGCAWLVPYLMFTRQAHDLPAMTAVWLLPLVAAEVAAASGGLLVAHLPPGPASLRILWLSYVLWGISVFPALGVLVILFLRMTLHKLPRREMAATSWLSLGPLGTGALALIVLGEQAPRVLAASPLAALGEVAHGAGVVAALALWGYGLWWLGLAVLVTRRYFREEVPFNMGWWAFTFPLGVYSLATLALARTLHSAFFEVAGCALVLLLIAFWVLVASRTLHGAFHGYLFVSPCLEGLPTSETQP
ncbi:MAG: TDT family transporter [Gammaproteobacteria bacterium]